MRWSIAVAAVVTVMVAAAPPAGATTSPPPQVQVIGNVGPTPGPEGEPEWELVMRAIDPDGVIGEVDVYWSDGLVEFADAYCPQGTEPGTVARLRIPHSHAAPGRYVAHVVALSRPACDDFSHEQRSDPDRYVVHL